MGVEHGRDKEHRKENAAVPRPKRRRRSRQADTPPQQYLREVRRRERDRLHQTRRKRRAEQPLRVWEDDGGAFWGLWDAATSD
jgi:hypothetical protein